MSRQVGGSMRLFGGVLWCRVRVCWAIGPDCGCWYALLVKYLAVCCLFITQLSEAQLSTNLTIPVQVPIMNDLYSPLQSELHRVNLKIQHPTFVKDFDTNRATTRIVWHYMYV